ncbi:MAG TPA: DUF1697 domain-containing protein, partial [Pyrinomonadaceae bacterium]
MHPESFSECAFKAMPKYVAFLRAINVGGHTVKMDYLRRLFEAMNFSGVETFIASGNVVFDATAKSTKALETRIEEHLKELLGYEVATFLRSMSELAEVALYKPFREAELNGEGNILYIAFLKASPDDAGKHKLLSLTNKVDEFHISGREVYWLRRSMIGESKFSGAMLEKALGMPATLRNSTTVKKLA